MSAARTTTDHSEIKRWVEQRGGLPARVAGTAPAEASGRRGSSGLLRIDFAEPDVTLEHISWDEFFRAFEQHELALLYQDEPRSRFVKLVSRHAKKRPSVI